MKAFVSACILAVVIAVVAWIALDLAGFSSAEVYSTSSTRL